MCFTLFATGTAWVADKFKKLESRGSIVFADPFVFLSGGLAAIAGRATFFIGFLAGLVMRVICNPINRVRDESLRTGESFLTTAQSLRKKTYLQFYYTTPNILANALYIGVLMVCFEGIRRFMERNGASTDNYLSVVATNTVAGGAAAAVASTVTYPYSAHRYLQTVIHDSAICRGLPATLLKEVPMMAVSFGVFSALQPVIAPHHGKRVGFGY
ncbi:Hypothetical protein, putative [Bodo saltans]|uniref:Uncharacterized protein n=1 Tax=Bodo saltans TaxID=75058 RepID=A0A0S4IQI4_BODSA|nr:Hypothetical protein, putative [Bodo saltans]|eukprot:CUF24753.1 Hypothetical protein, putative [Bodo saltans]